MKKEKENEIQEMWIQEQNQYTLFKNGRLKIETIEFEPSLTQQSFQKASDINEIMSQYEKTGELAQHYAKQGVYADISNLPDYQKALDTVQLAEEAFMALPAHTRKKFENNPQEMIQFLKDPNNKEEAIKLGLIEIPNKNEQTQTNENNKTNKQPEATSPS